MPARGDLRLPDLAADAHRRRPRRDGEERRARAAASSSTSRASSPRCRWRSAPRPPARAPTPRPRARACCSWPRRSTTPRGSGLPIVMTIANRAIGAPINIWNDHSDSMSQRDCGWIQLFAETNQEALDLHIQAFRLAEELSMPVMVCMDGFILTHAYERVDMPTQAQVDAFLPPYEPRQVLDPAEPVSIGAMVGPGGVHGSALPRARQADARRSSCIPQHRRRVRSSASAASSGGLVRGYRCEDAETIVVALGSVIGTVKDTVDELRDERREDRRARHPVVPAVPARRGARGARRARSASSCSRRASPSASAASFRPTCALALSGLQLHGYTVDRRPRRPRDHQGVARAHVARGDRRRARAAHLPRPRLAHRQPRARARERRCAAAGRSPRTCCATSARSQSKVA